MLKGRSHTIGLRIAADANGIVTLRTAMDQIGAEHGMEERPLVELQVALDEMVSNVIKYAWTDKEAHEIEVRITVRGDTVKVEIVDDGRMFNPIGAPQPAAPVAGQRPRPGGVGVHITTQLVDDMKYVREGNYNHTILTKRCAFGEPT